MWNIFKINNKDTRTIPACNCLLGKRPIAFWKEISTTKIFFCLQYLNLQFSKETTRKCSVRKDVLRNFANLTRKHLCQNLFFNKVAGMSLTNLLKKKLWHRCFPVNFSEHCFYRTSLGDCFCTLRKMINTDHILIL